MAGESEESRCSRCGSGFSKMNPTGGTVANGKLCHVSTNACLEATVEERDRLRRELYDEQVGLPAPGRARRDDGHPHDMKPVGKDVCGACDVKACSLCGCEKRECSCAVREAKITLVPLEVVEVQGVTVLKGTEILAVAAMEWTGVPTRHGGALVVLQPPEGEDEERSIRMLQVGTSHDQLPFPKRQRYVGMLRIDGLNVETPPTFLHVFEETRP